MELSGIILAAGTGRRIAELGDKPFLILHDRSFLETIIDKLSGSVYHPVIVVTNEMLIDRIRNIVPGHVNVILNPRPESGMLSSLHCAMQMLPSKCSGFLLHPVDYPLVAATTYAKLSAVHSAMPDRILIPVFNDRGGHPMIFPADAFDLLKNAPLDVGARHVVQMYPDIVHRIVVDDRGILLNINTPDMYRKFCKYRV